MPDKVKVRASLWYRLPCDQGVIEFPNYILEHFERYQQKCFLAKEAGGQLFWEWATEGHKRISAITGPRPTDTRSRRAYKADHKQELIEIDEHYVKGQYLMGDWHTHAEPIARPSSPDIKKITEIFKRSENRGEGFLLVIVGTDPVERSLSVSFCNTYFTRLEQI